MPVPDNDVHYLEIVTPDPEATSRFYADAYGWTFGPATPELGSALMAPLPGGGLCGIRAPMSADEQPIVRTYLRVADVAAASRRAAELGASVALEPIALGTYGTIAIYMIGGIQQGIWQVP